MNSDRAVAVEQAQIETATVTIRTVTINRKQMTLSVFKQLERARLLDPDTGDLAGAGWGHVNYFPGDCDDPWSRLQYRRLVYGSFHQHLHVIWTKDGALKRSCVYPPELSEAVAYDGLFESGHRVDRLARMLLLVRCLAWTQEHSDDKSDNTPGERVDWPFVAENGRISIRVSYETITVQSDRGWLSERFGSEATESMDLYTTSQAKLSRMLERYLESWPLKVPKLERGSWERETPRTVTDFRSLGVMLNVRDGALIYNRGEIAPALATKVESQRGDLTMEIIGYRQALAAIEQGIEEEMGEALHAHRSNLQFYGEAKAKYGTNYKKIAALPQLFIAV